MDMHVIRQEISILRKRVPNSAQRIRGDHTHFVGGVRKIQRYFLDVVRVLKGID
jgi:hypothetical protein